MDTSGVETVQTMPRAHGTDQQDVGFGLLIVAAVATAWHFGWAWAWQLVILVCAVWAIVQGTQRRTEWIKLLCTSVKVTADHGEFPAARDVTR